MKATFYKQCILEKKLPVGFSRQVSWIPNPFCVEGKILKLKEGDVWDDGWKVVSVSGPEDARTVETAARYYLKHRENTDI